MTASRAALALFFAAAGVLHFVRPDAYVRIVPPSFPHPRLLVLASGALEVAGGLGLLVPRLRRAAGWGLVLLLAAVFPANVHMALHPDRYPGLPPALLWGRLPLQALAIWWVLAATRARTQPPRAVRSRLT